MTVAKALCKGELTYFLFRDDGSEIEVTFDDDKVTSNKEPFLTRQEKQWFIDGKHKELED